MKIQKPTMGRIVEYTDEFNFKYPAVVVNADGSSVGLMILRVSGTCYRGSVDFCSHNKPETWKYPDRCDEMIEVE